jgi:tetraacyldisaccharide 4'-kinase
MNDATHRGTIALLNGANRSAFARIARAGLSLIEPFYAAIMRTRNALYDRTIFAAQTLPRPTISIGNLTTGGTGKTPVVHWLAERLIERGMRPAILMRGYRQRGGADSDEQRMLDDYLGDRGIVIANPDRVAGAAEAMQKQPPPDVFLLDDAFQHRRVARDFNLLLINAAEPFGFGHVLPRGLLREPIAGVRRADSILITHCSATSDDQITDIEHRIAQHNPTVPIFHCDHLHAGLHPADADSSETLFPMEDLARRRFFLFCGIGDPSSLQKQFARFGDSFAGSHFFADHHAYREQDLTMLRRAALQANADTLVTTEKDWVKVGRLPSARDGLPILRLELRLRFADDAEQQLLERVLQRI